MKPPGYNPMRWNCDASGCYNLKHRPKIELFAGALPRNIAMTDIDAFTEVGGRFLFLEFKGVGIQELPAGQRIAFTRLAALSPSITIVAVSGNPQTMELQACRVITKAGMTQWEPATLGTLHDRIKRWADKAEARKWKAA